MFPVYIALIISFLLSFLIVPKIRMIGLKFGIIDNPEARKVHIVKTVRIGGLAIISSVLLTLLFLSLFGLIDIDTSYEIRTFTLIIIGSISFFFIGILDDIYNLSPFKRLNLQFLTTIFLWIFGLRIDFIVVPSIININNFISIFISFEF